MKSKGLRLGTYIGSDVENDINEVLELSLRFFVVRLKTETRFRFL